MVKFPSPIVRQVAIIMKVCPGSATDPAAISLARIKGFRKRDFGKYRVSRVSAIRNPVSREGAFIIKVASGGAVGRNKEENIVLLVLKD